MARLIALSLLLCSCAAFVPALRTGTDQMSLHYPSAARVQLIGDWNRWGGIAGATGLLDPSCGVMENIDGFWTADLPSGLEKGRYRYVFLVNGSDFLPDPMNPDRALFFEHEVSVLIVN
jgi:hypothetical protein